MVYLKLFHGRKKGERLNDWGSQGPTLGPLPFVHTTYGAHVKTQSPDGECFDLHVAEDCLAYDGILYGDWSVHGEAELGSTVPEPFDQSKADRPIIQWQAEEVED